MKTLVVVPHLDDETFGLSGTLQQLCYNQNNEVLVVSLCKGRKFDKSSESRIETFKSIANIIGYHYKIYGFDDLSLEYTPLSAITRIIEGVINEFEPKRVFTVSENDLHQDHKVTSHAVRICCRPSRTNVKELYEFEIPESEHFSKTYFDTVNNIDKEFKEKMCSLYSMENIPNISDKEYFKTIYREFNA